MLSKKSKIYVAGHSGMVGTAVMRELKKNNYTNVIGLAFEDLDLTKQNDVEVFFKKNKPDYVINAAGKVGGISANKNFPYEFLIQNLRIQNNLIESALNNDVKKFVFIGTSSMYPRNCPQPLKEEYLLTGEFEPTNEAYSIAKVAGLKLCEAISKQFGKNFITLMPSNLYGTNDHFDLENSHVIQALIMKFHNAKIKSEKVILWGTGKPLREFTYVDDFANSLLFALEKDVSGYYNVGNGVEISIKELSKIVSKIVGFKGHVEWDKSKPDGIPRKLMDSTKFKSLGWQSKISIQEGISLTYDWFKQAIK